MLRSSFFITSAYWVGITTSILCSTLQANDFTWPEGKKAALSLSWDDARLSNVDVGTALLKKYGATATFYVNPSGVEKRLDKWKEAVQDGHEIANHTVYHPCSGNFSWARKKALENYNLAAMRRELIEANVQIKALLGVEPVSFAYSCGQTYVGRGRETRSYVPLVAELFSSGRGWMDEASNDPLHADLAQLQGIEMDGKDFEADILPILEDAVQQGNWVVFGGHEIGDEGAQTTRVKMLEQLLTYVQQPNSGIWLAPVGDITEYVIEQREKRVQALAKSLMLASTFDKGFDADFALGDARLYTGDSKDSGMPPKPGVRNTNIVISANSGRFKHSLHFTQKGGPSIFYKGAQNIGYDTDNWKGTISLWLSLDPEKELAPGYTDPIQITDSGYDDAAFWVDFSNKNPRSFRMGVYGDVDVWNPKKISPDVNPGFHNRLLPAKDRPFGTGIWTHVVISFSGINSEKGLADFYINGIHQGKREITEPFTWDLEQAKIFVGLSYVGKMDEVAIFDRDFSAEEVTTLYQLEGGLVSLIKAKNK